jgi:hypothetical protein
MDEQTAFYSKGRGRSLMISDFLVQHPSGPFFDLREDEWQKAVHKYPSLLNESPIQYVPRSATGSINVGTDGYFDNDTVLQQFERLFQMLQFRTDYKAHDIEVLVDNARTHTAKEFSIHDFGKSIGTRCPMKTIEYTDEKKQKKQIHCHFTDGPNEGKSKGLLVIARELNIIVPNNCKLDELKLLLAQHPCFKSVSDSTEIFHFYLSLSQVSKLEQLATLYKVKVIFGPKNHCELNPIEGLWCSMKRYVRRRTDQNYRTMLNLISDSRTHFVAKNISEKLFRRFWKAIKAYKDGQSYAEVLTFFFSNSCKSDVSSHRRVTNQNLTL